MSTSGPGEQLKQVTREQIQKEVINSSEQSEEMEAETINQGQTINLNTKKQHQYKQNKGVICLVYLLKILCFAIVVCIIVAFVAILTGSTQSSSDAQKNGNKTQAVQDKVLPNNLQINQIESTGIEQKVSTKNLSNTQKQEGKEKQRNETFNKTSEPEKTSKMIKQNIILASSNRSDYFALPEYSIPITQFPPFQINNQPIDEYGIGNDIQIGSIYDYLNVTNSSQFKAFKQNWNKRIKYEKYQFEYNSSLETSPSILQYSSFKDLQQMQNELNQLSKWQGKQPLGPDLPLYLSCHLIWNSSSIALKELELFYLTKKYNLNKYKEQLPFCIFSTGYKIASRQRHIYLLDSIERQNYTNYHVVAVDDDSPDSTAETMYQYLKQRDMKLKNKIKIIKNKVNLGATMSTYYWAKQLCKPGEIIVHIDMDDMLLGNQVLKVLNSIYHNQNTWYVYTRYLRQDNPMMTPNAGKSRAPNFKVKQYRHKIDWRTSALRTLRYEVMNNIPIEAVVQYHYDRDLKILFPKFYDTDADRFLIYPQLQLCGDHRIRYIDDVFYYYNISYNVANKCNMRHQHFDEYKSRIKRGYEPMKQINDKNISLLGEQEVPMNVTRNLKDRYKKLMTCLKQKNMTDRSITRNRNV